MRVFASRVDAERAQAALVAVDQMWSPVVEVNGGWALKIDRDRADFYGDDYDMTDADRRAE